MNHEPEFEHSEARTARYRWGPHWFALLATVFTWPLLFVGGLVTTYRVGMAVPDWPTTFGINMFLYDMTQASWAVFGEHSHRLYGAAVGFFTLLLAGEFLIFERRPRVRWLGVVALVLVIAQGVLGGFRVRLNSTALAAVHGVTAQGFFGLMVAICVLTGRSWFQPRRLVANPGKFRRQSLAMLFLVSAQVAIGAWLRHFSEINALAIHSILAVLVLGHGLGMAVGIERKRWAVPELVPAARTMGLLLCGQIVLGVGAWWLLRPYDGIARSVTLLAALIRTGHQANAGLLMASVVVLTLRSIGQLAVAPGTIDSNSAPSPVRDLEAVA